MYAKVKPKTCVSLEGLFVEKKSEKDQTIILRKFFVRRFCERKRNTESRIVFSTKKQKKLAEIDKFLLAMKQKI